METAPIKFPLSSFLLLYTKATAAPENYYDKSRLDRLYSYLQPLELPKLQVPVGVFPPQFARSHALIDLARKVTPKLIENLDSYNRRVRRAEYIIWLTMKEAL